MEGPIDDSAMFELLGRFLAGECTPAERAVVEQWMAASPENAKTFEALKAIWEQAPAPDPTAKAREDRAWERLQRRMQAQEAEQQTAAPTAEHEAEPRKIGGNRLLWRIAALLVVCLSIGLVFVLNQLRDDPRREMLAVTTDGTPLRDTLPDGTVVHLNAHSRLEYPAQFAAGERVVSLQGEGFFEVAHDAAHPFRIVAGAADVRVLGTSFNLSTRGAQVRVAVQTGTVELSAHDSLPAQPKAKLLLTAGMAGSYDGKKRHLRQEAGEVENDQFWRTGKLVFRDAPLERVVAQLNAVLQDSIVLANPSLGQCRLNTSFSEPSIDAVIAVITATFDLQVTRNGNVYQFDGSACN